MAGRIVLYGATGYTGTLTAGAMVASGARPVLAGRDQGRLDVLAARLAQAGDGTRLETAVAGAAGPGPLRDLIGAGDVIVSTAGPFLKIGRSAVEAAVDAGAVYLDSSGEPPFIRQVFEEFGPRAERTGAVLLTAFGYDYVPGNLAGALALEAAGPAATQVRVGYFVSGNIRRAASAGTRASGGRPGGGGGSAIRGRARPGRGLRSRRPGERLRRRGIAPLAPALDARTHRGRHRPNRGSSRPGSCKAPTRLDLSARCQAEQAVRARSDEKARARAVQLEARRQAAMVGAGATWSRCICLCS